MVGPIERRPTRGELNLWIARSPYRSPKHAVALSVSLSNFWEP